MEEQDCTCKLKQKKDWKAKKDWRERLCDKPKECLHREANTILLTNSPFSIWQKILFLVISLLSSKSCLSTAIHLNAHRLAVYVSFKMESIIIIGYKKYVQDEYNIRRIFKRYCLLGCPINESPKYWKGVSVSYVIYQ